MNILLVEDDASLRGALCETLELAGFNCLALPSGQEALRVLNNFMPDLVLTDVRMDGMNGHELLEQISGIPCILMTAYGTVQQAVSALKNGAVDYLTKPIARDELMAKIRQFVPKHISNQPIAADLTSQALLSTAKKVAKSEATVLIAGESGTGKEVLARYIHDNSNRANKPFIAINCAAIPENMLEATLFGYEKGAFTGAYKSMPGKFEQAQGGTLLLDEISEMDVALQVKLLRVLQEKEVERLGGIKIIKLDVRVLATSNKNMLETVKAGAFREDLYYRLNVFPLQWPALRHRRVDIIPLAHYLLARHSDNNLTFSPEAVSALEAYDWPGNAREMDNVIQRALILQSGHVISARDLQLPSKTLKAQKSDQALETMAACIKNHTGSRQELAKQLNMSERTLRYKLAKMREMGFAV